MYRCFFSPQNMGSFRYVLQTCYGLYLNVSYNVLYLCLVSKRFQKKKKKKIRSDNIYIKGKRLYFKESGGKLLCTPGVL